MLWGRTNLKAKTKTKHNSSQRISAVIISKYVWFKINEKIYIFFNYYYCPVAEVTIDYSTADVCFVILKTGS